MPSKLAAQSQPPDVSQLKKMMNNRKMANLSVSAGGPGTSAQHQVLQVGLPGVPVVGNVIHASAGNGGHATLHFPISRKGSGSDVGSQLMRSHHRVPSDPEAVARMITFGSMPSYREDKMQELKRHKDSFMRSKSIESNLSPATDGQFPFPLLLICSFDRSCYLLLIPSLFLSSRSVSRDPSPSSLVARKSSSLQSLSKLLSSSLIRSLD